jgi:hypothetical protein
MAHWLAYLVVAGIALTVLLIAVLMVITLWPGGPSA